MLFNLEFDSGKAISGYLVPDGFSEQPGIRVFEDGEQILEMDCNQYREAIMASGRHATGMIGFRLDKRNIPQLPSRTRLVIRDRKTGMLVYRRPQRDDIIRKKVFRLESRLNPFLKLDKYLDPRFQFAIAGIERFGLETALQAFHLHAHDSIYISGRLLFRNFEDFLDRGFSAVTMVDEPYHEMADRIFLFHRFSHVPERILGDRDRMIIAPAVDHFADVDLTSVKSLRRSLRRASETVKRILTSPLTRQLVSSYPEQAVNRMSIAPAIDTLSRFAVIGLKQEPDTFTGPLAEFIGLAAEELPQPVNHSAVAALAERLKEVPEAEALLEFDLILYHFTREAIQTNRAAEPLPQNRMTMHSSDRAYGERSA